MATGNGKRAPATMASPFSKGADVSLHFDKQTLTIKGTKIDIQYHYYMCQDTGQTFTTGDIDQLNLNLAKQELIPYLAEQGFMIEIGTDGWANWDFDDNGRPIRHTATPNRSGYVWRGCYKYFTKTEQLICDDVGTGLYKECLDRCLNTYQRVKHEIDPDAFGSI